MLKEGLDVYLPLVDDDGIDGIIRRADGSFTEFQIKARSKTVVIGDAALFAALEHDLRTNYWFIFFSERLDSMWILTSDEFVKEAYQNKKGANVGKRSVWFNGTRTNKQTGEKEEYVKERWKKYLATDFDRLKRTEHLPTIPKQITLSPDSCNGRPVVRGTRIAVQTVLEFLAAGDSPDNLLREYPNLTREDIQACLDYASRLMAKHTPLAVSS